jgi:hypothetical protein
LIFQGASNSFNITNPGSYPSVAFTINSSGNVGIGTTSPITRINLGSYTGSRLPYINGTANTFDANGITVTSSNTANAAIGGGLDLTNNVHSVGSFSPLISFSALSQSGTYNNNYAAIYGILAGAGGDSNWNTGHIVFATADSYGASEKMRITSAGNVGIGTTSPAEKLHAIGNIKIEQTSNVSAILTLNPNSGVLGTGYQWNLVGVNSAASYAFQIREASTAYLHINNSAGGGAGNVGIGTTAPYTTLTIGTTDATAEISSGGPNTHLTLKTVGAAGAIRFFTVGGTTSNLATTESMRIAAGGNVLIGTTTDAGYKLDVSGSGRFNGTGTNGYLYISGNAGAGGSTNPVHLQGMNFSWNKSNGGGESLITYTDAGSGSNIRFGVAYWNNTTYSEQFSIVSSGNVGIGTTSPISKLDVNGSIQAGSGNTFGTGVNGASIYMSANSGVGLSGNLGGYSRNLIKTDGTSVIEIGDTATSIISAINISAGDATGVIALKTGGNNTRLHITSGGNVGIGTTAPGALLQVGVSNNTSDALLRLGVIYDTTGRSSRGGITWHDASNTTGKIYTEYDGTMVSMVFGSLYNSGYNSNQLMIIRGNGNVGIGTTSPQSRLDLSPSLAQSTSATLGYSANAAINIRIPNSVGDVGQIVFTNDAAPTAGYASIGTIMTSGAGVGVGDLIFSTKSVGSDAASTERMRITSAGNVGIGTTSPTQLLSVAGNTDLGNSIGSVTSSTYTTRLSGYALYYDASNRYGNYGVLLLNADSGWTSSSRRFMITNGYSANKFAIIRSVDSTTDPALGYGGSVTSGTVDFEINSAGAATFGSSVTASSLIKSGGTSAQYLMADGSVSTLTNPVTGTGTTNYVPKFTSASAIGNSNLINDASGNLGLGVTPSAWNSAYKAFQFGTTGALFGESGDAANYFTTNTFIDSVGFKYITSDWALGYFQENGVHSWKIAPSGTAGDAITFTQAMTLTAGGNLGIGTTSPGQKLTLINGTFQIGGTSTFSDNVEIGRVGSDNNMAFATGGTERMRITSDGNVSIGTAANPGSRANIYLSESAANPNAILRLQNTGSQYLAKMILTDGNTNDAVIGYQGGVSSATQYLGFGIGTAITQMILTAAGNVGIGTTSPGYTLDVQSNTTSDPYVQARFLNTNSSGTEYGGILVNGTNQSHIRFLTGTSTWGGAGAKQWQIRTGIGSNIDALSIYSWTAGYDVIYFNSSGNVGIGTTSPTAKLDVSAGTNLNLGIQQLVLDNFSNDGVGITFSRTSSDSDLMALGVVDSDKLGLFSRSGIIFATGGTSLYSATSEQMRITEAGNVGIGTTSPGVKLEVNGASGEVLRLSMPITYVANAGPKLSFWNAASEELGFVRGVFNETGQGNRGNLLFGTRTSDALGAETKMTILHNGNVGIGTTSPAARLQVAGSAAVNTREVIADFRNSSDSQRIDIRDENGATSQPPGLYSPAAAYGLGLYAAAASAPIILYAGGITNSEERMRILGTNGNVGIGTASPGAKLHNYSTATSNVFISGYGTAAQNDWGAEHAFFVNANNGIIIGKANAQNDTNRLYTFYNDAAGNAEQYIYNTSNTATIKLDSAGDTYFNGGNVGIGTTGPTEKLHVDGSTLITYNNSFQSTNSVGNKAILARVSPTSGIVNYAEYATATNLNGFVIGSDDARVKGNITGDSLEFITNTSTRMTVLSSGNVGINTTTPGSTLHVVGDVLIQTGALGVGVNPNATDGRIDASNDIVAFSTSDKRLKENITPIANALEKVRSLTGVEFDWKEETKSVHGYEGHDVGVIAQDVQAVLPEAVRTNDTGYLSVRYEKMIALLIEANKELANRVEQLEKLIK